MFKFLIKKISFPRLKNLLLLRAGYWVSIITRKPHMWALPASISIEPVNYCNLHCVECPLGNGSYSRNKEMMSIDSFQKIINQFTSDVFYLSLYFQGEPLLNPQFSEMVKIANKKGIFTLTSTNGHFFSDEEKVKELVLSGLNHIIVSVDGTTQEVYEQYRKGGDLEKVISGIDNLVKWKKELKSETPFIEIQFLVMSHNEHQIRDMRKLCRNLKVDKLSLKTTQIYSFENGSVLMPKDKKYCRYSKQKDGKYRIKGHLKNRCWKQWSSGIITTSGDFVPCCFDKNIKYSFGNLFDKPFRDIWNNKEANDFRKAILENRKDIDICRNCSEV